jgi:predicted thioesterase
MTMWKRGGAILAPYSRTMLGWCTLVSERSSASNSFFLSAFTNLTATGMLLRFFHRAEYTCPNEPLPIGDSTCAPTHAHAHKHQQAFRGRCVR